MFEGYEYFYWVAKTGNITKASEKLFISQPGLSKAIQKLEVSLNCKLFERSSKGMKLTAAGKILYESVDHITSIMGYAQDKLRNINQDAYGEIVIGSGDELINNFLAPAVSDYFAKYPNVILKNPDFGYRCSEDIIQGLIHKEVDLGLVNRPVEASLLHSVCLGHQNFAFIVGVKYWDLITRDPLPLEELQSYPLMTYPQHTYTRSLFEKFCRSRGLTFRTRLESGSISVLLNLAKENLGLALVTREAAMSFIKRNLLFEVHVTEALPERSAYLIWRRDETIPEYLQLFIDQVQSYTGKGTLPEKKAGK